MKRKRVLVTGAEGFIGSHLIKELKKRKISFKAFSHQKGWDIRNLTQVMKLPKADVVIHLAAQVSAPESLEKPQETLETNVLGTLNVLEYCRLHQAKIIFPSSFLVYGKPDYLPINEKHPLEANNPYALSKILGEDLCQRYSKTFGIQAIILRFFNVYGAYQSKGAAVPTMINSLIKEGKIIVNAAGVARDFVYVSDVTRAIMAAVDLENEECQVFNIGSGQSTLISDLAEKIIEATGVRGEIVYRSKKRVGETDEIKADIKKTQKVLGWQPETSLPEGLKKTCQYYLDQSK